MSPQETTTVAAPCRGTECEQHERVGFVHLYTSHVLHLVHSIHLSKMRAISTKQNYQEYQQIPLCIRAPPKQGRYWEIHPQRPRDILRPKRFSQGEAWGKSWGSRERWRGCISQYLHHFGGLRTFSSSLIHLQRWIRKSIPVGRKGLTVLKSILPRRGWENVKSLSFFLIAVDLMGNWTQPVSVASGGNTIYESLSCPGNSHMTHFKYHLFDLQRILINL